PAMTSPYLELSTVQIKTKEQNREPAMGKGESLMHKWPPGASGASRRRYSSFSIDRPIKGNLNRL
ncbi:hypothetical protein, partial [Nitrosospira briensis]|uniref:hypothetical protein n=1 Tax=Nitrosospira briensis TaxID=35799 RepID=UPI001C42F03A